MIEKNKQYTNYEKNKGIRKLCSQFFQSLLHNQWLPENKNKNYAKNYELEWVIASGGFGIVYYSPPNYAVKKINLQLNKDIDKYLETELKILQTVKHKNILHLHQSFKQNGNLYIVTRYYPDDLYHYLQKFQKKKFRKFTQNDLIRIFKQICQGFQYLQSMKIVHRDVKIQNILINQQQEPVIADFGLSKLLNEQIQMDSGVGTLGYWSPQIQKGQKYTSKTDIWSLGVMYLKILIWIKTNNFPKLIRITQNIFPPKISTFSQNILQKMLQKEQKDRISWQDLFAQVLGRKNKFKQQNMMEKQRDKQRDKYRDFDREIQKLLQIGRQRQREQELETQLELELSGAREKQRKREIQKQSETRKQKEKERKKSLDIISKMKSIMNNGCFSSMKTIR